MRIHADDFGICKQQAEAILELNSSWNSKGTLIRLAYLLIVPVL